MEQNLPLTLASSQNTPGSIPATLVPLNRLVWLLGRGLRAECHQTKESAVPRHPQGRTISRWYMDTFGPDEMSTDRATIKDDEREYGDFNSTRQHLVDEGFPNDEE